MQYKKRQGSALLIVVAVIAVVLLAIGLFYILNRQKTATAPNSSSATSTATPSSTGSTVTTNAVNIKNMAFTPDNITVKVGSTVTWTNEDNTVHTVTANDGSFASDSLANGKSYSHTFNTPGTYKYRCVIHPNMTGIVTVTQ